MQMDPDGTKTQTMQAPPRMQAPAATQPRQQMQPTQQMQAPQAMAAPPMANLAAGMQMDPDQSRASDMRARQEMQKADLMGKIVDMVGSANPEVLQMLENAPISELMKALQEMTDAGGVVTKAAGGPIRYFQEGGSPARRTPMSASEFINANKPQGSFAEDHWLAGAGQAAYNEYLENFTPPPPPDPVPMPVPDVTPLPDEPIPLPYSYTSSTATASAGSLHLRLRRHHRRFLHLHRRSLRRLHRRSLPSTASAVPTAAAGPYRRLLHRRSLPRLHLLRRSLRHLHLHRRCNHYLCRRFPTPPVPMPPVLPVDPPVGIPTPPMPVPTPPPPVPVPAAATGSYASTSAACGRITSASATNTVAASVAHDARTASTCVAR